MVHTDLKSTMGAIFLPADSIRSQSEVVTGPNIERCKGDYLEIPDLTFKGENGVAS